MKFDNATSAIEWFWGHLIGGGVPLQNRTKFQEEYEYFEQVQTSRKKWLPHDALCTYIDIGKALEKLSPRDQNIVKSYLLEVVGIHEQEHPRTPYFSWRYQGQWPYVKERFWKLLPREYKYGTRQPRKQTTHTKGSRLVSSSGSDNSNEDAEVGETQRFQGWQPLACTC